MTPEGTVRPAGPGQNPGGGSGSKLGYHFKNLWILVKSDCPVSYEHFNQKKYDCPV